MTTPFKRLALSALWATTLATNNNYAYAEDNTRRNLIKCTGGPHVRQGKTNLDVSSLQENLKEASTIDVQLFANEPCLKFKQDPMDVKGWVGREGDNVMKLVEKDGAFSGSIRTESAMYHIDTLEDGVTYFKEVENAKDIVDDGRKMQSMDLLWKSLLEVVEEGKDGEEENHEEGSAKDETAENEVEIEGEEDAEEKNVTDKPTLVVTKPHNITEDCPVRFSLNLTTDQFGIETKWAVLDTYNNDKSVLTSGGPLEGSTTYNISQCFNASCYEFVIYDTGGDGICCNFGEGEYSVTFEEKDQEPVNKQGKKFKGKDEMYASCSSVPKEGWFKRIYEKGKCWPKGCNSFEMTSSSFESSLPCKDWCHDNDLPWIAEEGEHQKCDWMNTCAGCSACGGASFEESESEVTNDETDAANCYLWYKPWTYFTKCHKEVVEDATNSTNVTVINNNTAICYRWFKPWSYFTKCYKEVVEDATNSTDVTTVEDKKDNEDKKKDVKKKVDKDEDEDTDEEDKKKDVKKKVDKDEDEDTDEEDTKKDDEEDEDAKDEDEDAKDEDEDAEDEDEDAKDEDEDAEDEDEDEDKGKEEEAVELAHELTEAIVPTFASKVLHKQSGACKDWCYNVKVSTPWNAAAAGEASRCTMNHCSECVECAEDAQ